jgi:transmembrane sensor
MDYPGPENFNEHLKGYLRESLNPQELDLFFKLAAEPANCDLLAQAFQKDLEYNRVDLTNDELREDAWKKLQSKIETTHRPVRPMRTTLRWVAVVVFLLGVTVAIYKVSQSKSESQIALTKSEMKTPVWLTSEHIGATLFLSDGDSIALNNQDKGTIANQDGMQVLQSDGFISYSGKSQTLMYNEIRTAKGKVWRVLLPDQTIVWLNGGSSIKYPLQFGAESRTVEMTGEIYFEVSHHQDHPFRVKTGGQQIEDIGTSFNVKSYADDRATTTSLVEGAALVTFKNHHAILNKGQQSIVSNGNDSIQIKQNANLTEALAWKNGFFYFQNAGLRTVMKQLSEWYQAGVIYNGREGSELFSGQIDKSLSLSDVLQGLQQPGVKFSLEKNQITVFQQ